MSQRFFLVLCLFSVSLFAKPTKNNSLLLVDKWATYEQSSEEEKVLWGYESHFHPILGGMAKKRGLTIFDPIKGLDGKRVKLKDVAKKTTDYLRENPKIEYVFAFVMNPLYRFLDDEGEVGQRKNSKLVTLKVEGRDVQVTVKVRDAVDVFPIMEVMTELDGSERFDDYIVEAAALVRENADKLDEIMKKKGRILVVGSKDPNQSQFLLFAPAFRARFAAAKCSRAHGISVRQTAKMVGGDITMDKFVALNKCEGLLLTKTEARNIKGAATVDWEGTRESQRRMGLYSIPATAAPILSAGAFATYVHFSGKCAKYRRRVFIGATLATSLPFGFGMRAFMMQNRASKSIQVLREELDIVSFDESSDLMKSAEMVGENVFLQELDAEIFNRLAAVLVPTM